LRTRYLVLQLFTGKNLFLPVNTPKNFALPCLSPYKRWVARENPGRINQISAGTHREGRAKVKPIKMFGLAVLAALMAMAFAGTSSAMAEGPTSLCEKEESPCASPITTIHETSVGKTKLLSSSLPTIECNVLFSGKNTELSNLLVISGFFTYSSCNNFCSVSQVEGQNTELKVLRIATELGSVLYKWELHLSCPFINCVYDGEGLEGMAKGPLNEPKESKTPNGSVVITKQKTHIVSGSCPEEAFLDITTTPLKATYISS
jgi:hypothetical protein